MLALGSTTTTFDGAGVALTILPGSLELPGPPLVTKDNGLQPAIRAAVRTPARRSATVAIAGPTSPVRGISPYGSPGPRRAGALGPRAAISRPLRLPRRPAPPVEVRAAEGS